MGDSDKDNLMVTVYEAHLWLSKPTEETEKNDDQIDFTGDFPLQIRYRSLSHGRFNGLIG